MDSLIKIAQEFYIGEINDKILYTELVSGIPIKKKVLEMIIASLSAAAISFSFGKILQHFFNVEI
jgi:uncharacterized protein (DUF697 family)